MPTGAWVEPYADLLTERYVELEPGETTKAEHLGWKLFWISGGDPLKLVDWHDTDPYTAAHWGPVTPIRDPYTGDPISTGGFTKSQVADIIEEVWTTKALMELEAAGIDWQAPTEPGGTPAPLPEDMFTPEEAGSLTETYKGPIIYETTIIPGESDNWLAEAYVNLVDKITGTTTDAYTYVQYGLPEEAAKAYYDETYGAAGQAANDAWDSTFGAWGQAIQDWWGGVMGWFGDWWWVILIVIVAIAYILFKGKKALK